MRVVSEVAATQRRKSQADQLILLCQAIVCVTVEFYMPLWYSIESSPEGRALPNAATHSSFL